MEFVPDQTRQISASADGHSLGRAHTGGADVWPTPGRGFVATHLEVVTVTATTVVVSWVTQAANRRLLTIPDPVPSGTRLLIGPADGIRPLILAFDDPEPVSFHQVEVTGLEPGRQYRFEAWSDGLRAVPGTFLSRAPNSPETRGEFTTLTPPPGDYLMTIGLINDLHLGEHRQGIDLGWLPTVIKQEIDQPPYPTIMFQASLADLRERFGRPLALINGDLTTSNSPQDCWKARQMLDDYGCAGVDWLVTRGNHDQPRRVRQRPQEWSGPALPAPSLLVGNPLREDAFGDYFVGFQQMQVMQHFGLRIVAVDTTDLFLGGGAINSAQFEALESELTTNPEQPTLVMTHHPITDTAARTNTGGPIFVLNKLDRMRLQRLQHNAPGVFLNYSGHTHRMRHGVVDLPGSRVQHLEGAATSGYPCGYSTLQLYTGGYQVNFRRPATEQALRWCYRARWANLGIQPEITVGSIADRNHVVLTDLTGLVRDPKARTTDAA